MAPDISIRSPALPILQLVSPVYLSRGVWLFHVDCFCSLPGKLYSRGSPTISMCAPAVRVRGESGLHGIWHARMHHACDSWAAGRRGMNASPTPPHRQLAPLRQGDRQAAGWCLCHSTLRPPPPLHRLQPVPLRRPRRLSAAHGRGPAPLAPCRDSRAPCRGRPCWRPRHEPSRRGRGPAPWIFSPPWRASAHLPAQLPAPAC